MTREAQRECWQFIVGVYARPGVEKHCLALQEAYDADVPLLLFAGWLGTRCIVPDVAQWDAARALIRDWRCLCVKPLRKVRQDIRSSPLIADPAATALRERIKALELEAEKIELAHLVHWSENLSLQAVSAVQASIARNLVTLLAEEQADLALVVQACLKQYHYNLYHHQN